VMRLLLALHTSDLARIAISTNGSARTRAVRGTQEIYTNSGALRARSWYCRKNCRTSAHAHYVGSGHRTKRVANNNTSSMGEPVVRFGSRKSKLSADGVGVKPSKAVSANSAPLTRGRGCIWIKEVDVALMVAMSTGEGDSSGCSRSCSHSMIDLSRLESDRERTVDRRHDSLR